MTDHVDLLATARAEALFTSPISVATCPTRAEVNAAIQRAVRTYGGVRGCAAEVAAAYGEYPETSARRMRWALRVIDATHPAKQGAYARNLSRPNRPVRQGPRHKGPGRRHECEGETGDARVLVEGAQVQLNEKAAEVVVSRYLELAARGVRSPDVAAKIARHLGRFQSWFADGYGHDRVSAVTPREVAAWRDHLAAEGNRDRRTAPMAPATVNNHLAHLSALFTWSTAHGPSRLLPHGDPAKRVEPLRLPAPEPRALGETQVRTVKNVLDRLETFHQLTGRRHRGTATLALHRHARPLRDRAIVHLMLGTGLRRAEIAGLDLGQLSPTTRSSCGGSRRRGWSACAARAAPAARCSSAAMPVPPWPNTSNTSDPTTPI